VGAAQEDKHRGAVSVDASDHASVARNRWWREMGEVSYWELCHRPAE
jgi:hypothetical protein